MTTMIPTIQTQEAVEVEALQESAAPSQLPAQGNEGQQLNWKFTFFYDPEQLRPDVEKEILETQARVINGTESLVDLDLGK